MKLFTVSNFLTLFNLLSGVIAIIMVLQFGDLKTAGLLMGASLIFDFFDGFTARLLKESSELGKQLDSLADVVSFGVLPGIIAYKIMYESGNFNHWGWYALAMIIPLFSALRLGKFNIDTRQSTGFIGFPTPSNAVMIGVLPFLTEKYYWVENLMENTRALPIYIIISSYLLISELPMPSLKFKNFSWKDNKLKFISILALLIALPIFRFAIIPVVIIGYVFISVVKYLSRKK